MQAPTRALLYLRGASWQSRVLLAALVVAAAAAAVLVLGADTVLAQRDAVSSDLVDAEKTAFFDRAFGRRVRHLCTGLSIVGAIIAVIRAANKGIFSRSGGGMGGAGGSGGVGQIFKHLIAPLVACALLLNLNWTFSGIGWMSDIGADVLDEIGNWFSTTPGETPDAGNGN